MKLVAQQNPIYPHLEPFKQLERITEVVKDATATITPDDDGILQTATAQTTPPQPPPTNATIIPNDDEDNVSPPRVTVDKATPPRVTKLPKREDTFGQILQPTQHQYPTRARVNNIETIEYNEPLPPYFVNAIMDHDTGELNPLAYAALHGCIKNSINAVIDSKTGKKKEYRHLISDDETKDLWGNAMHNELGRLMNGTKSGIIGTKPMTPIRKMQILNGRKVMYLCIVVDI